MSNEIKNFDHLIRNLERISLHNSIFNYNIGQKAFLSYGQGNIREWLENLLPNTRLILEPRILGSTVGIQYINGELTKAINKDSRDITKKIRSLRSVPKRLAINKRLEIQGVIYKVVDKLYRTKQKEYLEIKKLQSHREELKFCATHIFHCRINQFNALKELKNLNFEIPQTYFTNFISDIDIYHQCWKDGKLFKSYPTNGILLKINSRKLQKRLGENNVLLNWAYAIN